MRQISHYVEARIVATFRSFFLFSSSVHQYSTFYHYSQAQRSRSVRRRLSYEMRLPENRCIKLAPSSRAIILSGLARARVPTVTCMTYDKGAKVSRCLSKFLCSFFHEKWRPFSFRYQLEIRFKIVVIRDTATINQ